MSREPAMMARSSQSRAAKQPTRPTAFVNARLIDPAGGYDGPGGLLTQDGAIADCGPSIRKDTVGRDFEIVDCGGKCLAPGLVDMRVQLREPGEEHKETIATGTAAAAAGGVTSMVCLPNTDPVIDDVAAVEFIARRARDNRLSKVYCYGAITRKLAGQELVEFGLLAESGALAFTDGLHAVADARVMLRALKYSTAFDVLMVQFPEEPALARNGAMNAGELATRLGLTGIAPQAEVMMIERDMHLLAMSGARYHVSSLSTAASVEAVRTARARGLNVTCDTAPHYFALDENEVGDYRTFAKVSPPLRRDSDRAAIAAAVADGTIDCVVSDHAPHDQDSKRVPFAQAASGVIGLETLLAVALELVHKRQIDLIGLFRRLALAPADLLRLPQGRLTKGAPADLVLFDPDTAWQVDPARMRSKSKNSAFDGRPVQGRVLKTVVDGRVVFDAG